MSEEKKEKVETPEELETKTRLVTAEVEDILDKHGLTMRIAQNIQIVPKQ